MCCKCLASYIIDQMQKGLSQSDFDKVMFVLSCWNTEVITQSWAMYELENILKDQPYFLQLFKSYFEVAKGISNAATCLSGRKRSITSVVVDDGN